MPEEDIETIELRLLLEALHARYGYDLRGYAFAPLKRRLQAALAKSGLGNLSELQHALLREPALCTTLLEELTLRITDMFRDPEFYRVLRARVVPLLRTYPLLKIWHAGCSTGEEVYASAILLREEQLYERTQIYGTDLSAQALEQARQRVYPAARIPTFTRNYEAAAGSSTLAAYYTEAYGHVAFRESLAENVLFFQHDLVSDYPFGEMQVIFCRNVLIYFDVDLRDRVLEKFAHSLCPGGFLCLGASEALSRRVRDVFEDFAPEQRIYRHTGAVTGAAS